MASWTLYYSAGGRDGKRDVWRETDDITALLADINKQSDTPWKEENITHVSQVELSFYPSCCLYEVLSVDSELPAYVVRKPGAAWMLDWSREAILRINRALNIHFDCNDAGITGHIKDYIRFFLSQHRDEEGRFVIVEQLDDVPWSYEPSGYDRKYVGGALREMAVTCYQHTGYFEVRLTVLRQKALKEVILAVSPLGDVVVAGGGSKRLTKLPVVNDALCDLTQPSRLFNPESGWSPLAPDEEEELGDLFEQLLSDPGVSEKGGENKSTDEDGKDSKTAKLVPSAFIEKALVFLTGKYSHKPARLVKAVLNEGNDGFGLYAILTDDSIYVINGSSAPIHNSNEGGLFALHGKDELLAYCQYFCLLVHGNSGPFRIVTQPSDLNVDRGPGGKAVTRSILDGQVYDELATGDLEGHSQTPIARFAEDGTENEQLHSAKASVQYGDALFNVSLKITRNGLMEMDADLPYLLDIPITDSAVLNFIPFFRFGNKPVIRKLRRAGLDTVNDAGVVDGENSDITPDEKLLGCCVVDIGRDRTVVTVFQDDAEVHVAEYGLLDEKAPNDIALFDWSPEVLLEHLKTHLGRIRDDLTRAGQIGNLVSGYVLRGLAAQLFNISELAEAVFKMPVRVVPVNWPDDIASLKRSWQKVDMVRNRPAAWPVISAADFYQAVTAWSKDTGQVLPESCVVRATQDCEQVELEGLDCGDHLVLDKCHFECPVSIVNARVHGCLVIKNSTFSSGLRLHGCNVDVDLDITNTHIYAGHDRCDARHSFNAVSDTEPSGNTGPVALEISKVQAHNINISFFEGLDLITGSVKYPEAPRVDYMDDILVAGSVNVTACEIKVAANLVSMRVSGGIEISDTEIGGKSLISRVVTDGDLSIVNATTFRSHAKIDNLRAVGGLYLDKSEFKRSVVLNNILLGDDLSAEGTDFRQYADIGTLTVGGELLWGNCKLGSDRIWARAEKVRKKGVILADDFIKQVKDYIEDESNGLPVACLVLPPENTDTIDLRGIRCPRRLSLKGIYFACPLDLSDVVIEGPLDLSDATVENTLNLEGCQVEGSLNISGAWVSHTVNKFKCNDNDVVILDNAVIDGAINAGEMRVEGNIRANYLEIGGQFSLDKAHIFGDLNLKGCTVNNGAIMASSLRVEGGINADYLKVNGSLKIDASKIGRHLDISNAELMGVAISSTKVGGNVNYMESRFTGLMNLWDVNIQGELNLQSIKHESDIFIRSGAKPAVIGGGIEACNAEIAGDLVMSGLHVRTKVRLMGADIGRLYIGMSGENRTEIDCDVDLYMSRLRQSLTIRGADINGCLDIKRSHFGSLLASIDIYHDPFPEQTYLKSGCKILGIDAAYAKVDSELSLFGLEVGPRHASQHTGISSETGVMDVDLRSIQVGGSANLAWNESDMVDYLDSKFPEIPGEEVLQAVRRNSGKIASTTFHGELNLSGASIKGDLTLGEATIQPCCECQPLNLYSLECHGDVDLKGLQISCFDGTGNKTNPAGGGEGIAINGEGVQVDGALMLCAGEVNTNEALRNITGELNLDNSVIGSLIVSGGNFREKAQPAEIAADKIAADKECDKPGDSWASLGVFSAMALSSLLLTMLAFIYSISRLYEDGLSSPWGSKWFLALLVLMLLSGQFWKLVRLGEGLGTLGSVVARRLPLAMDIDRHEAVLLARRALFGFLLMFMVAVLAYTRFLSEAELPVSSLQWIGLSGITGWLSYRYLRVLAGLCDRIRQLTLWYCHSTRVAESAGSSGCESPKVAFAYRYLKVLAGLPDHLRQLSPWFCNRDRDAGDSDTAVCEIPKAAFSDPDRRLKRELRYSRMAFRDLMQVINLNRSFRPGQAVPAQEDLSLEHAKVGHMQVVGNIPVIDFSKLGVDHWTMDNRPPGDLYLELLEHGSYYDRSSYTRMVQALRNEGDRERAEEVHRAMSRYEQGTDERWLRTSMMLLHSLVGYGTRRARIMLFMLLWFLFTWWWVAAEYPYVTELTPDTQAFLLEIQGSGVEDVVVRAKQLEQRISPALMGQDGWTRTGQGFALALRYHLPIINWDPWPYLAPKGEVMWTYMAFVSLVHWVLWPLLLASLIQTLIPQRET